MLIFGSSMMTAASACTTIIMQHVVEPDADIADASVPDADLPDAIIADPVCLQACQHIYFGCNMVLMTTTQQLTEADCELLCTGTALQTVESCLASAQCTDVAVGNCLGDPRPMCRATCMTNYTNCVNTAQRGCCEGCARAGVACGTADCQCPPPTYCSNDETTCLMNCG
jgi:hypothetical protein